MVVNYTNFYSLGMAGNATENTMWNQFDNIQCLDAQNPENGLFD